MTGAVPPWLLAILLLRDAVISVGSYAYRRIMGRLQVRPTRVSKINTFVQLLFVVIMVANNSWMHLGAWWLAFATGGVAVAAVMSGADYVWTYGLPALEHLWIRKKVVGPS